MGLLPSPRIRGADESPFLRLGGFMPYEIKENSPQCDNGFAVVKVDDGRVIGCHPARERAQKQITALNIAENLPEALQGGEEDAPNYKMAEGGVTCANCRFGGDSGFCELFAFDFNPEFVCDSWQAAEGSSLTPELTALAEVRAAGIKFSRDVKTAVSHIFALLRKSGEIITPSADAKYKSLMVSVPIEMELAQSLAIEGGIPANELHMTLGYCGDISHFSDKSLAHVISSIEYLANDEHTLDGQINGFGRFNAKPSSDMKDVIYAVPDIPGLENLRGRVLQMLTDAGCPPLTNRGFTPHITLAYIPAGAEFPIKQIDTQAFRVHKLVLSIGDKQMEAPFGFTELATMCAKRAETRLFNEFAFADAPEWIPYLPLPGRYHHPQYGEVLITRQRNQHFVDNINGRVYGQDIPIDAEHESKLSGAMAYIKEAKVNSDGSVDARVEWTDRGRLLVESERFKYFSPEWYDEWTDPATGETHQDIAIGGAITTRPFYKEDALRPLIASELIFQETPLGDFIRERREEMEMTLEEFAKLIDAEPSTAGNIERGVIRRPPPNRLALIAKALDVSLSRIQELVNMAPNRRASRLGAFIRRRREEKEMSLEEFAQAIDTEPSTAGNIERGVIDRPPPERLELIARALDVPLSRLTDLLSADENDEQNSMEANMSDGNDDVKALADAQSLIKQLEGQLATATAERDSARQAAETDGGSGQMKQMSEQLQQAQERILVMETAARQKRFTEIVNGRSGSPTWFGKSSDHVSIMETMADEFGEDSTEFKKYAEMQRAMAQQLIDSNLFVEFGSDNSGSVSAEKRIAAEAKKLMETDTKFTYEQAYAMAIQHNPKLYAEYRQEVKA